jgi:hypothetical protein
LTEIASEEHFKVEGIGKVRFMLLANGQLDIMVDSDEPEKPTWAMRGLHYLPYYLIKDLCEKFGTKEIAA